MNKLNKKGLMALLSPLLSGVFMAIVYSLTSAKIFTLTLLVYVSIYSFVGVMGNVWVASKNPDLINTRLQMKEDVQTWDKITVIFFMFAYIILVPLVAGIEARANGLVLPMESFYIGLVVFLISSFISIKAMLDKPFFVNFVSIQKESNHQAVDRGLYKIIRHPAYTALLLNVLSQPILLRSRTAFFITIICIIIVFIRTAKEDKFLQENLVGYIAYCETVKDRLIPYIY